MAMYISREKAIRNGRPCVTGTAIEVESVVGALQSGLTRQEVLARFPALTAHSLDACLAYAFVREATPFVA